MAVIKNNTSDKYILDLYKVKNQKEAEYLKKLSLPYELAYGNIFFKIEDVFCETGGFEYEPKYYGGVRFLGNINGKTENQLQFKTEQIKREIEGLQFSLEVLEEEVRDTIKLIREQHGKTKNDLSILSYLAKQ